jgi:hypothetical protein
MLGIAISGALLTPHIYWKPYKPQTATFAAQNLAFISLEELHREPTTTDTDNMKLKWQMLAVVKNGGNAPASNIIVDVQGLVLPPSALYYLIETYFSTFSHYAPKSPTSARNTNSQRHLQMGIYRLGEASRDCCTLRA